jgi:Uri superfamily endonuclease
VGALGRLALQPGFYVYVGSAFGPGGLAALLAHHLRPARTPHWHIDYLRRHAEPREVWFVEGVRREHAWAGALATLRSATAPLARFGATDCACHTHLLFFPRQPRLDAFGRRIAIRRGS